MKRWLSRFARLYDSDRRGRLRMPLDCRALLTGDFGALEGVAVDAHRDGMAVRAQASLPIGTRLFVRIPDHLIGGYAEVRRCSPSPDGFILGLELSQSLVRYR